MLGIELFQIRRSRVTFLAKVDCPQGLNKDPGVAEQHRLAQALALN